MTNTPPDAHVAKLIAIAAEMRATGQSWETIGKKVHRSGRAIRRWPLIYPLAWNQTFRRTQHRLLQEVWSYLYSRLLKFANLDDPKTAFPATRFLMDKCCQLWPTQLAEEALARAQVPAEQLDADTVQTVLEVRRMSDEQRLAEIESFATRYLSPDARREGTDPPPSPAQPD